MQFFLLASLVALAVARPQTPEESSLRRWDSYTNDDGSFVWGFETTDPIQQDVAGQIKQIGEKVGVVMQGSYSFEAEDENGVLKTYTVNWVANENGFQATGDGIPEDPNAAAQAAAYANAPPATEDQF